MANRTATQLDYETAMTEAADIRIQLSHKPDVFNEKLSAQHALLLEEQAKLVAGSLAEAANLIETVRTSDAKLTSILNGKDAQVVMQNATKTMDDIIFDNSEGDLDALQQGRRMAIQAAQAEAELKEAQARVNEEMKKNIQFEASENLQQMFSFTEETAASEDENENTAGDLLFNFET